MILLRIMRYRTDYNKLKDLIPRETMDAEAMAILDDFGRYFDTFPSHAAIDMATFFPRFKEWHPHMSLERFNGYKPVIVNALTVDPDEDQRKHIMQNLSEIELMTRIANLAEQFNAGDLPDAYAQIGTALDGFRSRVGLRAVQFIDTPIGELLQDEFDDSGISWPLECLNNSMRKLRPGDFGIMAGRPDKGKTTLVTQCVTHWAPQLPPERNIIWLNNEGPGRRIIPRMYQSALNLSMTELKEAHSAGTLVGRYRQSIGGRLDKIRVIDVHGLHTGAIESILEESNPGVVVYDMMDNIKGFGDEARTDLVLEAKYQWARERMVKYNCIGVATSQISNDGDGQQFPTLGMLKDSKTGKQGACDFQLMIGASNDPNLIGLRYLGLPKNKLRKPDGPSDPRATVEFDGLRARYKDVPVGS